MVRNRFQRTRLGQDTYEDITDGLQYKKIEALKNPNNMSLLMNTDGVRVFKSSNYGIWPVYFTVNELPYNQRTKRENCIFAGVWFGVLKPPMIAFLEPFAEALANLQRGQRKFAVYGWDMPVLPLPLGAGCPRSRTPRYRSPCSSSRGRLPPLPYAPLPFPLLELSGPVAPAPVRPATVPPARALGASCPRSRTPRYRSPCSRDPNHFSVAAGALPRPIKLGFSGMFFTTGDDAVFLPS
ncbi:hypothetical protein Bbelb_110340 [Branchiostoma belcheri]|nr:hypothetical protein Bbelb_110340 [Branchiostoma belcheri]